MKFTKLFTFVSALAVLFSSCNSDELDGPVLPGAADGFGVLTVTLQNGSGAFSRSVSDAGTSDERKISSLAFYVFDAGGSRDAEFGTYFFDESQSTYTFAVTAGSKVILPVLNIAQSELEALIGESDDLGTVQKVILNREIQTPLSVPTAGIPMSGEGATTINDGEEKKISISVDRLYARFDAPTTDGVEVDITLAADLDSLDVLFENISIDGNTEFDFDLTQYYVINGLDQSFIFPNIQVGTDGRWDPAVWTIGSVNGVPALANYFSSVYGQDGEMVNAYSGSSYLTDQSVYVYENSPLRIRENGVWGYDSKTVYSFIIEGKLIVKGTSESVTRYWRVNVNRKADFGGDTENYEILRNAIYQTNILSVKTIGYGTPKDAEEEKPIIPEEDQAIIEVEIIVAPWTVFSGNTSI